jgi:dienelactone hydrolase
MEIYIFTKLRKRERRIFQFVSIFFLCSLCAFSQLNRGNKTDTFQILKDGFVPQTVDELWVNYDPTIEPLDVEILDEWKESDGIICKVIRYNAGMFKGVKAKIAALYAYPQNKEKLPGLVQVHGGGQHANLNMVISNARRGYACIAVNWQGNQMRGLKNGKDWIWEGANTDWGAVDAIPKSHDHYYTLMPGTNTIDSIYSPRNSNWFLGILAVRRAITFLQNQPEVDPDLIGLYGHSMGGKLTFDVSALDKRVKVAVPSASGQLEKEENQESEIRWRTIASKAYASHQSCPIFFLNPSNDFYGKIEDIEETIDAIPNLNYRLSRDPQQNHHTNPNHVVCGLLWIDQYLKGNFSFPKTPVVNLSLDSPDSIPCFMVRPEINSTFIEVDVYYSRGAEATGRYWEWAKTERKDSIYYAKCPLLSTDDTIRFFANIRYKLDHPVTGASYYYQIYTADSYTISSRMLTATPKQLKLHDIKATDKTSTEIENFDENWEKRWYVLEKEYIWPYRTHKLNDKKWIAPSKKTSLSVEILSKVDNNLQIELDDYFVTIDIKGKNNWQEIELEPSDFRLKDNPERKGQAQVLNVWTSFNELIIGPGSIDWKGALPTFRNLKWKLVN